MLKVSHLELYSTFKKYVGQALLTIIRYNPSEKSTAFLENFYTFSACNLNILRTFALRNVFLWITPKSKSPMGKSVT